jgi:hypothetical protein
MITYNTFIQRFKDFADNHYFIRSFSHGAPEDVDLEKFNEYPLMHVIYTGANYEDTTKTLSFEVYIFDLPSHYENKQDRQKEVVSDAEQCAEDVIADIVNGGNIFVHEEDYTVQTARVTPLQEESSNVLAGVLLEVDIQIPYDRDACNAPIDGVSPEGGEIVYARRGVLRVRTVNSSTDVLSVRTIVVPNGRLTDDGDGQVTLDFTSISTLVALSDVDIDDPIEREALVYDEATGDWINGGPATLDYPVKNNTFSTITKGTPVQFVPAVGGSRPTPGAVDDHMNVTPFSAASTVDPSYFLGVALEDIPGAALGYVRAYGTIAGLNTSAYLAGTILYASVTTGQLTSTPPTAPNHRIQVGIVNRSNASTGRLFVRSWTPGYRLRDISDVNTQGVTSGEALVYDGSKWRSSKVLIPASGTPPPGGWPSNVMYQDPAGELTNEDAFNYNASTNTLAVDNITGTTVTGSGVVKGSNTFGQRYATQAATNRAAANTASLTVERYFTVTAEGNGESFNIQSNTPSAGNKIVRKIWYKDEAFEATDVDTWTLLHTFADDTTYANTATKWQEYLDGQTNGTPPFTLAISWEEAPQFTGLLDTYSGAEAAYSLRLLRSAYTGSAIRVRRASDNTEQDIGFDANGDFNTSALTTFCSGTNGFVKTWYDQSGNGYDVTQTTTANQPQIFSSSTGIIELANGTNAAVDFLSSDTLAGNADLQTPYTIVSVFRKKTGSKFNVSSSGNVYISYNENATNYRIFDLTTIYQATTANYDNADVLRSDVFDFTNNQAFIRLNGTTHNITPLRNWSATNLAIGRGNVDGSDVMAEVIVWNVNQAGTNLTGIESNISTYYGI